ncbi:TPA: trp operon leader peptide [Escherichia coli]|nr:trp operon leader peptide [Escherichia coli]
MKAIFVLKGWLRTS